MILITGANGFVGHKLMELCKDTVASPSLRNATQERVFVPAGLRVRSFLWQARLQEDKRK